MRLAHSLIFTIFLVLPLLAQQYPSVTNRIYWPGMWRPEQPWGRFQLGYWYKDQFNVTWGVETDCPMSYPYYSSNAFGINDTAKLVVVLDNRSNNDIPIASISPENWFYPVLYDPYVDVFNSQPLADTSLFEYRFEYWILTVNGRMVSKPDTLLSLPTHGYHRRYALIYSIWGVYPGIYRVILKPTSSKPAYVKLSVNTGDNYFEIRKGQQLQDTLNSYAAIAASALSRNDWTLFNSYVDSIFYKNPQSILGWALRYHKSNLLADTTTALAALDSFLVNITNGMDPLIPDSSEITPIESSWLDQWKVDYEHYKSRMLYPQHWKLPPR